MAKVKICGLTRLQDIEVVNVVQPDYIGFVFATSRRQVTFEQAACLKQMLNPRIQAVGVFVNEALDDIEKIVRARLINIIQLHGQEDEAYIKAIKNLCSIPVIKAVAVQYKEDVQRAEQTDADYLLFDHKYGGSGTCFDWTLIGACKKPFFLAGGLHIGNLTQALTMQPFAVDISSGAETNGVKDARKIGEIVRFCRNA